MVRISTIILATVVAFTLGAPTILSAPTLSDLNMGVLRPLEGSSSARGAHDKSSTRTPTSSELNPGVLHTRPLEGGATSSASACGAPDTPTRPRPPHDLIPLLPLEYKIPHPDQLMIARKIVQRIFDVTPLRGSKVMWFFFQIASGERRKEWETEWKLHKKCENSTCSACSLDGRSYPELS